MSLGQSQGMFPLLTIQAFIVVLLLKREYGELLWDLNLIPKVNDPIEMLCDSTAAIPYANNPKFHWKTKHIKRGYHFVGESHKDEESCH